MMIGYHAVPVIVDAYLKGIGDFDAEKALEVCVATANIDEYRGIGFYKQKGYIPYNVTDEYNSENWSLSRIISKRDTSLIMSQMNIIPRTGRCQEHWNMRSMIFV